MPKYQASNASAFSHLEYYVQTLIARKLVLPLVQYLHKSMEADASTWEIDSNEHFWPSVGNEMVEIIDI